MEIKGTNVNLNQKVKEDSQAGKKLAKEIMLFADDNSSAVSKSDFQAKLNKMEKLSTQDLIKFIRSFDKDESIIELICDEIGDDKKVRKDACKKVLSALTNKAKELGIDTKDFEQQFIKELDRQFNSWGTVNTEKLDEIINAITQSIENRQNFTPEDVARVQNTPVEVGQEQANGVIENRLEKAYSAFGERVGEDGEMTTKDKDGNLYNGQMQRDGIAADIADCVSRIWGSENTAAKVREDLKATNAQLQQLKEAKLQGEEAYKAKFKEIFGVEYDYANMVAYQKAEQTYINASANHEFEMMFNRTLKTLISPAPLREEFDYIDGGDGKVIATKTATKEQVYNREFNNLANFIGENGTEILNKAFTEKGVANGTIEEKFEVLKQIAKSISKELHSATLEAGGGKEFSEVQAMYDNSYKAAYGVENDIMKRVSDYNVSQEVGAAFTKAGAVILTTLATAGLGGGLVATAAATSLATVGAEVIDRGTSGKALDALREQGLGEYLDVVGEDVDWEATLKQAAMSGGAVLIGGGVAQGVTAIMKGSSSVAQFAAMLGSDVITDATLEFLTTKQITWQGMVFTVLLSTIGNAVQLSQMKKAADATKSADEAIDGARTNIATGADIDIRTKLADVKGPDGKPFLTKSEINKLLENCQDGFVTDGKPIPDFEARIMAVLSNPKEIANIASWKSRSAGVWRSIQAPLQSTVDINPAAFGVKPKAAVPKQTAPSQKLPDVVDKIYGGKAEAEAVVFGNGTLADINPSIVENATVELTKYFGREIKASDLQVVRNSNGAYISYFDPETGLATTFSNSGKLNGQFKIEFDAQGNIQSFDLETIYADGKFWLR